MSANLTDVDAFTSPVVVPSDGDPENAASVLAGFQPLANRTRYLYNRLTPMLSENGGWSVGDLAASAISYATNDKINLATLAATSGLTLAANEITFVNAGTYAWALHAGVFADLDVTDPLRFTLSVIYDGSNSAQITTTRYHNNLVGGVGSVLTGVSGYGLIGATAGKKLSIKNGGGNGAQVDIAFSRLTIVRLF